jgi:hypothetical protein
MMNSCGLGPNVGLQCLPAACPCMTMMTDVRTERGWWLVQGYKLV